jgi:hypothetical protein
MLTAKLDQLTHADLRRDSRGSEGKLIRLVYLLACILFN